MRKKLFSDIPKSCLLCEHAKKVAVTGEILCARTKNLKRVAEDYYCRKFSFDILAYRPGPARLPKFNVENPDEIL